MTTRHRQRSQLATGQRLPTTNQVKITPRTRRRGPLVSLVLLLLLVGMTGCSTAPPVARDDDTRLQEARNKIGPAIPIRLAVMPVAVDGRTKTGDRGYRFPDDPPPKEVDPAINHPFLAGQELSDRMMEFFTDEASSPFQEVIRYDIPPPGLTLEEDSTSELPTLRLNMRVNEFNLRFAGRNGCWTPNLFFWAMLIVPSLFVADEDYTLRVDIDLVFSEIFDPHDVLFEIPVQFDLTASLDDFDRGWQPLGIFYAPKNLRPWNWDAALERMAPLALREAEILILDKLGSGFRETVADWTGNRAHPPAPVLE